MSMPHSRDKFQIFIIGLLLGLLIGGGFFVLKLDAYFKVLNSYKNLPQKEDEVHDEIREENPENQTGEKIKSNLGNAVAMQLKASEDLVVRKDELLAVKQLDMINLSYIPSDSKDSLLQNVSGIRDDGNKIKQAMSIEFWHSPINYKGYKMAKSKLVLFGIMAQEAVLYMLDENIYIKLQQDIYKLEYTNDFRQMEKINDGVLLARLK
jgi:hypothetical protein